jgi:uncharacterized protein YidB (DUF937 family)
MLKELLNKLLGGLLGGAGKSVDPSVLIGGLTKILLPQGGGSGSSGGGLSGLIDQFTKKGMGDLISGWVSTGPNPAITPRQVRKGFSPDMLEQFARHTGLNKRAASSKLSKILPSVIDKLTPDGKVPESSQLENGLKALKDLF